MNAPTFKLLLYVLLTSCIGCDTTPVDCSVIRAAQELPLVIATVSPNVQIQNTGSPLDLTFRITHPVDIYEDCLFLAEPGTLKVNTFLRESPQDSFELVTSPDGSPLIPPQSYPSLFEGEFHEIDISVTVERAGEYTFTYSFG